MLAVISGRLLSEVGGRGQEPRNRRFRRKSMTNLSMFSVPAPRLPLLVSCPPQFLLLSLLLPHRSPEESAKAGRPAHLQTEVRWEAIPRARYRDHRTSWSLRQVGGSPTHAVELQAPASHPHRPDLSFRSRLANFAPAWPELGRIRPMWGDRVSIYSARASGPSLGARAAAEHRPKTEAWCPGRCDMAPPYTDLEEWREEPDLVIRASSATKVRVFWISGDCMASGNCTHVGTFL